MAQNVWNKVEQGWNRVYTLAGPCYLKKKYFISHFWIIICRKGPPKGKFRPNEGPSVEPGAVNEVVKSFNMVPLVRPDVYP